ncbi:hypothetical protein [Deinococcus hohokamensis]|uniref:Uncharacterized protein n=1 Tax=Deinococcus hohokamensis TaxID=309883 RepID=A0ABV9I8Y6_9DEIO
MTPLGLTALGLVMLALGAGLLRAAGQYDQDTEAEVASARQLFTGEGLTPADAERAARQMRRARRVGSRVSRWGAWTIVVLGLLVLLMAVTLRVAGAGEA